MPSSFSLAMYPWVYKAKYTVGKDWSEEFTEKQHQTPAEEAALSETDRRGLLDGRNSFPELPLVNYTTQYGLGCFEGLKAFPQQDGSLKIFRPDENAKRMARSMDGLMMPAFPPQMFVDAVVKLVKRNAALGFRPAYDPAWEKDGFVHGHAVYLRPFSYSEPGIGLNMSVAPWVVMIATEVGSYFDPDASTKAITTEMIRATPGGTGWIKCDANYVIPILAKKRAQKNGYMEAIFLDAESKTFVEEGSSCNIFFRLEDDTLVTPSLEDTVLPGINRASALALATEMGVRCEERKVAIDEVMDRGVECFVTGTAAGVSFIESIDHRGKTRVFGNGKIGELTRSLRDRLKGIQYGAITDSHGWMVDAS
jgi:branched-chain amino acid aminotransferase